MNLYPYVQRVMALLWNRCFTIRQVAGHESDPFRKLLGHEIPSACENLAFLNPSHHTNPSAEAASHCNPFDQVSTCGTAHLVSQSLLNACETSEKSLKVTDPLQKSVDFCTERRGDARSFPELQCLSTKWWKGTLESVILTIKFPSAAVFERQIMEPGGKWHLPQPELPTLDHHCELDVLKKTTFRSDGRGKESEFCHRCG